MADYAAQLFLADIVAQYARVITQVVTAGYASDKGFAGRSDDHHFESTSGHEQVVEETVHLFNIMVRL